MEEEWEFELTEQDKKELEKEKRKHEREREKLRRPRVSRKQKLIKELYELYERFHNFDEMNQTIEEHFVYLFKNGMITEKGLEETIKLIQEILEHNKL